MGVDLMSDNWNFLLVVTEGPHDVATITRVLRIRGYKELENENDVPDQLRATIPQKYPFSENGRMDWAVPRPTFLQKAEHFVIISNARGVEGIGRTLAENLDVLRGEVLQRLKGIALIADMDNENHEKRQRELIEQIKQEKEDVEFTDIQPGRAQIKTAYEEYKICFYFFPDNYFSRRTSNRYCNLITGRTILFFFNFYR